MQLNLPLEIDIEYGANNFVISACNFEAYNAVMQSRWFNDRLLIIGEPGSGKTHLCNIWAQMSAADFIDERFNFKTNSSLILQNIELHDEEFVFHVINHCQNNHSKLLMTNASFPETYLQDLRSRINATQCYVIRQPDIDLLKLILIKQFADMQIDVPLNVIEYALKFLKRDFKTMRDFANQVNNMSMSQKRNITLPFIKEYILSNGYFAKTA